MKPIFVLSSIGLSLLLWLLMLSSNPLQYTSFIPPNCSYYNSSSSAGLHIESNSKFSLPIVTGFKHLLQSFYSFVIGPGFMGGQNSRSDARDLESEVPWPIFQYSPGYRAENYALRRATPIPNSSCKSLLTESSATDVLRRINDGRRIVNASLNYKLQETNSSSAFAGNLDLHERKRYFHYGDGLELPCGFVNYPASGFLVSEADQRAMESCRGVVVISAIFGSYDRLRQPRHVKRTTAENVCFFMFVDKKTVTDLAEYGIIPNESHKIGLWRIVLVRKLPYKESVMNALIPKYLPHRLFPNCIYSIWADAKLQLVVDPLLVLEKLLIAQNVDIALSNHPYNIHTIQEAIFTVRWRKWGKEDVRYQMEHYCRDGLQPWSSQKLPYISDVPDTALILRTHSLPTKLFSCLLFNELHVFNPRDQLAFAYVRDLMNPKVAIHMFHATIFNSSTNEFRHSYKVNSSSSRRTNSDTDRSHLQISLGCETACKSYLDQMWNAS